MLFALLYHSAYLEMSTEGVRGLHRLGIKVSFRHVGCADLMGGKTVSTLMVYGPIDRGPEGRKTLAGCLANGLCAAGVPLPELTVFLCEPGEEYRCRDGVVAFMNQ